MPSKNPVQRLSDILENIDAIQAFTASMEFDAFKSDRKTVYAVVRALEIISEASRRLPDEIKHRYPAIDWTAVASAGNIYRHEYEGVDERLIWHTIRYGLDALRDLATTELNRWPGTSPTT
ncbi:MAG TPA: DUF86 domain-containing protein [Bryobacteraceae bacterium]|nr:DUF86 domain-containing protein [Bryobacteraceae bacterium]